MTKEEIKAELKKMIEDLKMKSLLIEYALICIEACEDQDSIIKQFYNIRQGKPPIQDGENHKCAECYSDIGINENYCHVCGHGIEW